MADIAEEVVELASDLIRIDTSNRGGGDCAERPAAEYVAERLGEAGLEPLLLESEPGRANVVVRLPGADPGRPALLVHGHLDVVPAEPADWSVHPFSGEVRDGWLWGRGAVDMKGMVAMMVALARAYVREDRRPARDVVLAFTADEEDSAEAGSDWLVQHRPELFEGCTEGISESGAYTFHAGGGVRIYPVGAGEKGTAWLDLTATGRAGHGSRVNRDNAVGALAARGRPDLRAPVAGAAHAHGPGRPDRHRCRRRRGDRPGRARLRRRSRSRTARSGRRAGRRHGAQQRQPDHARRRLQGERHPRVRRGPGRRAGAARRRGRVRVDAGPAHRRPRDVGATCHREVPLEASPDGPTFDAMRAALLAEDPGAHVVPVCLAGGTDAKQFSRLGITGYGFAPLRLPEGFDYSAAFHGVDERVPVDGLEFGVRVLDRFLETC